jgi:hypothetical protein
MTKIDDITELIFPLEDQKESLIELDLWRKACDEAYRIVKIKSPIALLRKTEEIYNSYIASQVKS